MVFTHKQLCTKGCIEMETIFQATLFTVGLGLIMFAIIVKFGYLKMAAFAKQNPINRNVATNVFNNEARLDNEFGSKIHEQSSAKKKTYGMKCALDIKENEYNVKTFRLLPQFRLNGGGHYS